MDGIGTEGQRKLGSSTALIVGVGGLGCPAAQYLAAAGVSLTLCDPGTVDAPDLQRQVLYAPDDVGAFKVDVAASRLAGLASIRVERRGFDAAMLAGHDVVLDCTDESGTHAYIHQSALDAGVPLVWAGLEAWEGQGAVITGPPCLRCLWPEPAAGPSCADVGVAGPVAGVMGTWQALQALRVLLGDADTGRVHLFDGRRNAWTTVAIARRASCMACAATK